MVTRQAYKANVELAFDYNGNRKKIEPEKISYIMISHNYDTETLPIIYVSLIVNNSLYSNILKYKESAKFYLSISKQNVNSTASLSKKTISGLFSYIPSSNNPNYTDTLNESENRLDMSYKKIMLGLISVELTNYLRKSFNGIYNDIDENTLINLALEGNRKTVIEKIAYNNQYSSIMVPPITSRLKFLEFIFNKDPFYDTNFRYFIDFDKSYLLSKAGNYINAQDGQLETIIVDIRSVSAEESYYEGVEIRQGAYYLYINPANSNVSLNEGTEKVANQIIATDDDDNIQSLNLEINKTIDSETKQLFLRTGNATLYKNELETNSVIVEIVKQNIDGEEFTPNKCIMVNNYGEYSKYNGKYIMIYKKEFLKCIAGEFVVSCSIGLKKVGNIEPIGCTQSSSSKKLSVSKTATKKSTSSKKYSSGSKLITSYAK